MLLYHASNSGCLGSRAIVMTVSTISRFIPSWFHRCLPCERLGPAEKRRAAKHCTDTSPAGTPRLHRQPKANVGRLGACRRSILKEPREAGPPERFRGFAASALPACLSSMSCGSDRRIAPVGAARTISLGIVAADEDETRSRVSLGFQGRWRPGSRFSPRGAFASIDAAAAPASPHLVGNGSLHADNPFIARSEGIWTCAARARPATTGTGSGVSS